MKYFGTLSFQKMLPFEIIEDSDMSLFWLSSNTVLRNLYSFRRRRDNQFSTSRVSDIFKIRIFIIPSDCLYETTSEVCSSKVVAEKKVNQHIANLKIMTSISQKTSTVKMSRHLFKAKRFSLRHQNYITKISFYSWLNDKWTWWWP